MEILSVIALVLIMLVGYSGGIAGKAGKKVTPKPQLNDLFLVCFIWAVILSLRFTVDINKWLYLLIGLGTGVIAGVLSASFRSFQDDIVISQPEKQSGSFLIRYWRIWLSFSKRLGHFQNRIFLSFFYLVLVSPVGILVKLFSDPLQIKKTTTDSHWSSIEEVQYDEEQFRRQY